MCRQVRYPIGITRWQRGLQYSRRVIDLLSYYCALHRHANVGYIGTACDQEQLAEVVEEFLGHPFSRDTLDRSHSDLVSLGLAVRSYTYAAEGMYVIDRKAGRKTKRWVRNRTVMYTLTDAARNIWSHSPTSDYRSATCGRIVDPPSGDLRAFCEEPRTRDRSGSADRVEAIETPSEEPLRGDVGHRDHAEASSGARAAPVAADQESRQSPRPVAPLATLADGDRMEGDSQPVCQRAPIWSREVQLRPRGAPPRTRMEAQLAILRTLRVCTYDRGRLEDLVIARAKAEMDPWYSGAGSSGLDWDYYLALWPTLDKKARKRLARDELIPLLAPASQGRSRRSPPAEGSPTPAATPRASPAVQIAEPPPDIGPLVRPPGLSDEEWKQLRRRCGEEVD